MFNKKKTAEDNVSLPGLVLYHYDSCPFCRRVRFYLDQNNVALEERDILRNTEWREELLQGGGKTQVPCLRIEQSDNSVHWMYESSDIVAYIAKCLDEVE